MRTLLRLAVLPRWKGFPSLYLKVSVAWPEGSWRVFCSVARWFGWFIESRCNTHMSSGARRKGQPIGTYKWDQVLGFK